MTTYIVEYDKQKHWRNEHNERNNNFIHVRNFARDELNTT